MAAMLIGLTGYGQFAFSVSPGLQINGATFGYKLNKFVPFVGLQVFNANMNVTETWKTFDYDWYQIVDETESYHVSATAFLPTIGVKYFFLEKNKLKAYGTASFTDVLLSAKVEYTEGGNTEVDDLKDDMEKLFVFSANIGFGTEYFFDDNFSVGGEFGFRIMHAGFEYQYDDQVYDANTDEYIDYKATFNAKQSLNPTYAKISMNFYF